MSLLLKSWLPRELAPRIGGRLRQPPSSDEPCSDPRAASPARVTEPFPQLGGGGRGRALQGKLEPGQSRRGRQRSPRALSGFSLFFQSLQPIARGGGKVHSACWKSPGFLLASCLLLGEASMTGKARVLRARWDLKIKPTKPFPYFYIKLFGNFWLLSCNSSLYSLDFNFLSDV